MLFVVMYNMPTLNKIYLLLTYFTYLTNRTNMFTFIGADPAFLKGERGGGSVVV